MNLREQAALEYDEHSAHLNQLAALGDDERETFPVQIQNTAARTGKGEPAKAFNSRGAGRGRKSGSAYSREFGIEPWQARRIEYLERCGRHEDIEREGLAPIAAAAGRTA